MPRPRLLLAGALLGSLLTLPGAVFAAGGATGGSMNAPSSSPRKTPEEVADLAYREGVKHNERARRYEVEAREASSDRRRKRAEGRAEKRYQRAVDSLGEAVQNNPQHYEALNELGFALRKLGLSERSVGAYNLALKIKPDYAPAMEYRAEALLALGYYDHVKDHYQWLLNNDAALASQLLDALTAWAEARDAGEAASAEFATWVEERAAMADAQASLLRHSPRPW